MAKIITFSCDFILQFDWYHQIQVPEVDSFSDNVTRVSLPFLSLFCEERAWGRASPFHNMLHASSALSCNCLYTSLQNSNLLSTYGLPGEFLWVMYKFRVHCLITKNSQYNKLQLVLGYRECAVVQCNHLGRCSVLNHPITNSAEAFGFLSCTLVFVWAIAVHCCKM